MERDEFLKSFGLGLALVCTGACFQACGGGGSEDNEPEPGGNGNDISINLSERILNIGDSYTTNKVLFIRLADGNQASSFLATEAICPHQGGTLVWQEANNRIECQSHFSRYDTNGKTIQGPQNTTGSTRDLKLYTLAVSGNTLTAKVA